MHGVIHAIKFKINVKLSIYNFEKGLIMTLESYIR